MTMEGTGFTETETLCEATQPALLVPETLYTVPAATENGKLLPVAPVLQEYVTAPDTLKVVGELAHTVGDEGEMLSTGSWLTTIFATVCDWHPCIFCATTE